jgi:poly-gamma-glutamate synthesis protein (capsule biosynthesis protein)
MDPAFIAAQTFIPKLTTTPVHENNSMSKLTVRCVGDIAPVRGALDMLANPTAGEFLRQLLKSESQSDVTVANLEAPVVSQAALRENKRYNLRTDVSALGLFGARSVLSLANNHIMDYGEQGLAETISVLNNRGIVHAGAGRNLEEASKPALINVDSVKVGVLCCADPRFQAATAQRAGTCPATVELVKTAVRELRPIADVVIVSVHMGIEFFPVPSKRQMELAEVCADAGISVLQFHHTHTISGIQKVGECTVLFGTGNFLFPYTVAAGHRRAWHRTAAWSVDISLDQGKPVSTSASWTPLLLDSTGLPTPAPEKTANRIDREIERWSERIKKGTTLQAWRLAYVFRPGYVWLAIVNYGDMVRRQGLSHTVRELGRGLRGSFMGRS